MTLYRAVRISYYPVEDEGTAVVPLNATIIAVETCTEGGLMSRRHPCGIWVEEVIDRFDRDTGRSVYRDELPPPEVPSE